MAKKVLAEVLPAELGKGSGGHRGQNARYTNITLLARVCLYVKAGNSKSDAFRKVGVHPDTGFQWLAWGKQEPPHHPILQKFYRVLEKCWASYNSHMVSMVGAAASSGAPNTWQAAMTMLERRDPSNWGRRDTHKIEGGGQSPLQLNQVILVDSDTRDKLRDVLRGVAGAGPHEPLRPSVRGELEAGEEVDSR